MNARAHSYLQYRFGFFLLGIYLFQYCFLATVFAEESHPGLAAEALYSEAVLAFNKKNYAEAQKVLDELITQNPSNIEALELKALTLRSSNKDEQSLEVYEKLFKLKPDKERGAYYFEVATILFKKKQMEKADKFFARCAQLNFNVEASRLYQGLIAFQKPDYSAAERHFSFVKAQGSPELKVVSRYYLGLVHFKNGYGAGGTGELTDAMALADDLPESTMAQDIKKAAAKILAPFNRPQWFANVSLLAQYDSNIAQLPLTQSSSSSASGQSTTKFNLSGGVGRMGSPMDANQWVPSYRFSVNKNLDSLTRSYEYATNTLTLYMNRHPLSLRTWGLKVEGTYTFQNQPQADDPTSYVFGKYALTMEGGAYWKYAANRKLQFQTDLSYKSQKFYNDDSTTGSSILGRIQAQTDMGTRFLSPVFALSFENNAANSSEYKYFSYGLDISNSLRLTDIDTLVPAVAYTHSAYGSSSTNRADTLLMFRSNIVHKMNRNWSLLGDFTWMKNSSSVESQYSYSRWMFSVGAGWAL